MLASVIVDEARKIPNATVCFFFCKYRVETRNSFVSVARSILAQFLAQQPRLLPFFFEKASVSPHTVLSLVPVAKEMMETALHSRERVYIIIDGLDECPRAYRKEISTWFQTINDDESSANRNTARCLFVSQDDGTGRKDLGDLPTIKVTNEGNQDDLRKFTGIWHHRLEEKFGELRWGARHIGHVLLARAQGKQPPPPSLQCYQSSLERRPETNVI